MVLSRFASESATMPISLHRRPVRSIRSARSMCVMCCRRDGDDHAGEWNCLGYVPRTAQGAGSEMHFRVHIFCETGQSYRRRERICIPHQGRTVPGDGFAGGCRSCGGRAGVRQCRCARLFAAVRHPVRNRFCQNGYVGRTFIKPKQSSRESSVRVKLNVLKEAVDGKRIIMIDDSIVRGTTSDRIVKMLRDAGATEVHVRISSPPFLWPCYFGTDIPEREQLIAYNRTIEEIRGHHRSGFARLSRN